MALVTTNFLRDYYEDFLWPAAQSYGVRDRPRSWQDWYRLHVELLWAQSKQVTIKRRKIKVARGFTCPVSRQEGLRQFRRKILQGRPLNPHLSTRSTRGRKLDGLLSHWGIYHFHLGIKPYPKIPGFVERTNHLLFAWVDDDYVYNIAVGDHNDFEEHSLIETVYDNWPYLMDRFRMSALPGEPQRANRQELREARRCLAIGVQIEDKLFMPPGGGVTTNGTSINARIKAQRQRAEILAIEEWAKEHAAEAFRSQGYRFGEPLSLRLHIQGGEAFAFSYSLQAGLRIPEARG